MASPKQSESSKDGNPSESGKDKKPVIESVQANATKVDAPREERQSKKKEYDKFIISKIFPDVKCLFNPEIQSIKQIKDNCLVVIDTNALFVPYNISADSLNKIGDVYSKLIEEKRLFIPAQVVREFAKNRGRKLAELKQGLLTHKSVQVKGSLVNYPLLQSFTEYQEIRLISKEIRELYRKYHSSLDSIIKQLEDFAWNDPVSKLYGDLLNNCIIEHEFDKQFIEADLENRNTHSIPPGFKDKNKDDEGIGDLLIWHNILLLGETEKKNLLFITNEEKSDWWYKAASETIYPRFELVDEYRRKSNGQTFQMISLSSFLDLFGVEESIVKEVKKNENVVDNDEDRRSDSLTGMVVVIKDTGNFIAKIEYELRQYYEPDEISGGRSNFYKTGSPAGKSNRFMSIFNSYFKDQGLKLRDELLSYIFENIDDDFMKIYQPVDPNSPSAVSAFIKELEWLMDFLLGGSIT